MNDEIIRWVYDIRIWDDEQVITSCPLISPIEMLYKFKRTFTLISDDGEYFQASLELTHFTVDGKGLFIRVEGEIPCEAPFFMLSDNSWKIQYAGPIKINKSSNEFKKRILKPKLPYCACTFNTNPLIIFRREDGGFDAALFAKEVLDSNSGEIYSAVFKDRKLADITLLNFMPAPAGPTLL